ncbi:hypothetical protein FRC12_023814 [Ceratobasidium sp. 428]|nr:hypothetical protein FRC12_023814 [Ceratobasidium sp. 428]
MQEVAVLEPYKTNRVAWITNESAVTTVSQYPSLPLTAERYNALVDIVYTGVNITAV